MKQYHLICPVLVAIFSLIHASDNVKRAPSGFQGVRGKKSVQDTYPETAPSNNGASNLVNSDNDLVDEISHGE